MGSIVRCGVASAILVAFVAAFPGTAAADAKEGAAAAYDKGAAAYDRADYATAAIELARADELAPNAVTLELAINAAVRTDDAVLAMTLVERAEKRKGTKALDKAADAARRKLSPKLGKLNVTCRTECDVKVDGKRFDRSGPRWIAVGTHEVTIEIGGAVQRSEVVIEGGKTVELLPTSMPAAPVEPKPAPKPPEPAPPPKPAESRGPSPTWFWIGLGATAIAGGATVVSGLDTASKHDAFLKDRSDQDAANAGKAADQRTVILIAGTGVLAAATAALGLFVVDWKGPSSSSSASGSRGYVSFTGTGLAGSF